MTPLERRIRALVYRSFLTTGVAPSSAALAGASGAPPRDVAAALTSLADAHLLVLHPGSVDVWMAHPFSAVPTPFLIETDARRYYANCAWDAAGILSVVGDGRCVTRCGDCGEELAFEVAGGVVRGSGCIHFLVPARRFWDNIAFT